MKLTPMESYSLAVRALRREHGLPVSDPLGILLQAGVAPREARLVTLGVDELGRPLDHEKPAIRAVEELVKGTGHLLVLSGDVGRGKSAAAAYGIFLRHCLGTWLQADELSRIPEKDTFPDHGWAGVGFLVVDDLGAQHSPSGYAATRVAELIQRRYAALLPTCITTNLGMARFAQHYGARVVSRLDADPLGFLELNGFDLRMAQVPSAVRPSGGAR